LEVDAGFSLYSKRDLRIKIVYQERNVRPRSRAITARNQNDFFHPFYPKPKVSGECEPAADVLRHPPAKITLRKSVFTPSRHRQG
jgi:hypothetical protein